jgi:type II secretory pathway predicted ATPase ExeA
MALISLRIPNDIAVRFSALALTEGGKSALLRRLISDVLEVQSPSTAPLQIGKPQKITVRLRETEIRRLTEVARLRGMTRTSWIVALVRSRLGSPLEPSPDEREALRAIIRELNRMSANINQIARAANVGALQSRAAEVDLTEIREAKAAVERTLDELRRIFDDNTAYWKGRR